MIEEKETQQLTILGVLLHGSVPLEQDLCPLLGRGAVVKLFIPVVRRINGLHEVVVPKVGDLAEDFAGRRFVYVKRAVGRRLPLAGDEAAGLEERDAAG